MSGSRKAGWLLLSSLCLVQGAWATPTVYGWVEKGLIMPDAVAAKSVAVKMKLDTGALTSSMDARALQHFERDGKPWVRFDLVLIDANTGEQVTRHLERPVERSVLVRGAGGAEHRPTVTMRICLGDKQYDEWFTLRDRSDMAYPVLLGRRLLAALGPVDSSRTFTVQPDCR